MNQYYSLDDVIRLLGKSRSTVLREAKSGLIPSELEPGRSKGRRYPKEAIDALIEILDSKQSRESKKYNFSFSTPNDLWAEVSIGRDLYGDDDIVPFKMLLEWREINDEMFMSLKDSGRVVAYSSLMPLDESILMPLINDEIRERDIPLNAIRQWSDPQLSVYVASVTIKPSGNDLVDTEVSALILRHTIKWALATYRQCDVKNWYGIGATSDGQRLFERLGFNEIVSLYEGERKGYKLDRMEKLAGLAHRLLD